MVVFWPMANLPPTPAPLSPLSISLVQVFLPEFRIRSELLTDLEILQLQWIADSSIFFFFFLGGGGILDFACPKKFLPGFRFENKILTEDLGDKA